ncbi:hypothetical protein ACRAWD_15415 [Caulobacter segnis]
MSSQSRFINEASTPISRRTGPISVVPRTWGGMTSPTELARHRRCRRQVRHSGREGDGSVPAHRPAGRQVTVTAPAWADLNKAGMVSGHAYAKGLAQQVKTCVGSDWCPLRHSGPTRPSTAWRSSARGSWAPAAVKLAVWPGWAPATARGVDLQATSA